MLDLVIGSGVWSGIWSGDNVLWLVGGTIAIVAIVAGTTASILNVRARERTKREIAAYVAEGSIDPKDAVKMLKAAKTADEDEECG